MDDKRFWELVEQMDWDYKKILEMPEEDQVGFCKTFEAKRNAMARHQTYCCDSAEDGAWAAVAWGKEHYDKLWKAIEKDGDHGSGQLCDYSYCKGKSGEMLGYRIRALAVLLGGPEDHYDIDPPQRFAKLLDMTIEEVLPLWNKTIRPIVETPERYVDYQHEGIRRLCRDPRTGKMDTEEFDRRIDRCFETWNEQYAEHVGAEPEVKTYKVRTVFLVEEDVKIEARSQHEAIRLAEEWAEENAGDREVMTPHSMYHCEGWEVEQS